jgi:hypothetical protein
LDSISAGLDDGVSRDKAALEPMQRASSGTAVADKEFPLEPIKRTSKNNDPLTLGGV